MTDIRNRIIEVIKRVVKSVNSIESNPDKSLLAGDLDSLDFASVLMALEDEFGLSLQDVDVEDLNTLNKLVTYVSAHWKA